MPDPAYLAIDKAACASRLSADDAYALAGLSALDEGALVSVAGALRDRGHGRSLTYSPKVFFPVTNLCRDRCSYCTFRRDPGRPGEWTMSLSEIAELARKGNALGCSEALMCLGDKPEVAFRGFRRTLAGYGAASTAEYLAMACETALKEGLLPHTNAGLLDREQMAALRPLNASMGLMLENVSPRLRDRGMPHHLAPDKEPGARLRMMSQAAELSIPFTTGILVGIGENEAERIASLLAIRELHERYGHIQEVIIQNFHAKADTDRAEVEVPDIALMVRTVAMARLILGAGMNLQAPPNLNPRSHRELIRAGINDWGGISPLTLDFINPEAPWPHLDALESTCREEGFSLSPRLPVYPEFENPRFLDPSMAAVLADRRKQEEPVSCLQKEAG